MARTIEQRNDVFLPNVYTAESLTAESNRRHARLILFKAVQAHRDPEEIIPDYIQLKKDLIPLSFVLWARRNQKDVEKEQYEFLARIFRKDVAIAERYRDGKGGADGKKVSLDELIQEEGLKLAKIRTQLKKLEHA